MSARAANFSSLNAHAHTYPSVARGDQPPLGPMVHRFEGTRIFVTIGTCFRPAECSYFGPDVFKAQGWPQQKDGPELITSTRWKHQTELAILEF